MRYTVAMTKESASGPYLAWLAKRGTPLPLLTAHPSNARWFKTKNIPTFETIKTQIHQAFGDDVGVAVISEEELNAWLVLRTLHESTFEITLTPKR